jgi:hypothetical protein
MTKAKRITKTRITVWKSDKDGLWYTHGVRNRDIVMDGGEGRKRCGTVLGGLNNLIQSFKDGNYIIIVNR